MDQYFEKIKEYLKMDTEISYEEFAQFYGDFMAYLNINYQDLQKDDLIKGRFICTTLQANSVNRSQRKNSVAKKFKKIGEKSSFWADAIRHRLLKEGMDVGEIEEEEQALHESI